MPKVDGAIIQYPPSPNISTPLSKYGYLVTVIFLNFDNTLFLVVSWYNLRCGHSLPLI